eukprot:Rhum_TRINITY_DN1083_c0_g2::Rhum_TRINITY_DN1083_c0_g2_i1::g.2965::m.2965
MRAFAYLTGETSGSRGESVIVCVRDSYCLIFWFLCDSCDSVCSSRELSDDTYCFRRCFSSSRDSTCSCSSARACSSRRMRTSTSDALPAPAPSWMRLRRRMISVSRSRSLPAIVRSFCFRSFASSSSWSARVFRSSAISPRSACTCFCMLYMMSLQSFSWRCSESFSFTRSSQWNGSKRCMRISEIISAERSTSARSCATVWSRRLSAAISTSTWSSRRRMPSFSAVISAASACWSLLKQLEMRWVTWLVVSYWRSSPRSSLQRAESSKRERLTSWRRCSCALASWGPTASRLELATWMGSSSCAKASRWLGNVMSFSPNICDSGCTSDLPSFSCAFSICSSRTRFSSSSARHRERISRSRSCPQKRCTLYASISWIWW